MRQKFGNYTIREDKVHPISRSYKAIVSADNSTEYNNIQEAIDDVNAEGGGVIFIKSGTYSLTTGIDLASNITLLGESNTGTIIDFNDVEEGIEAIGIEATNLRNIHIKNIQVQKSANWGLGAIAFQFCTNVSVENCRIVDCDNSGVGAGTVTPILFWGVTIGKITQNYANLTDKIELRVSCKAIDISGNYMDSTIGFMNIDDSGLISIINNYMNKNYITADVVTTGVFIDSSDVIFSGNTLNNLIGNGIDAVNGKDRSIISNNILIGTNNAYFGIELDGSNDSIVTANIISGVRSTGIKINGNADCNNISLNRIDAATTGIEIASSTADKNIVTGNNTVGCATGITDSGTSTTLANNITV